jgi:DNA-binding GntR family transcriptional regulator
MVYQAASTGKSSHSGDSAKRSAYREIFDAIVTGTYRPGEPLVERALVERHGTSRTSIREVLRELGQRGLVEIREGQGARVRALSAADLRDLFQVREALECLAVRLATSSVSDEQIEAQLRSDPPTSSNPMGMHEFIIGASGNAVLIDMFSRIRYPLLLVRSMSKEARQALDSDGVDEHRRILEAVRARDADLAEVTMREHLRRVRATVISTFFE